MQDDQQVYRLKAMAIALEVQFQLFPFVFSRKFHDNVSILNNENKNSLLYIYIYIV